MLLTKESLRTAAAKPPVEVEAFGGTVLLAVMTAQERGDLEREFIGKAEKDPMPYRYAILRRSLRQAAADGGVVPMFASDAEARAVLSQLDSVQVLDLFTRAQEVNGMAASKETEKN